MTFSGNKIKIYNSQAKCRGYYIKSTAQRNPDRKTQCTENIKYAKAIQKTKHADFLFMTFLLIF